MFFFFAIAWTLWVKVRVEPACLPCGNFLRSVQCYFGRCDSDLAARKSDGFISVGDFSQNSSSSHGAMVVSFTAQRGRIDNRARPSCASWDCMALIPVGTVGVVPVR